MKERKSVVFWTKERVKEIGRKYTFLKDFRAQERVYSRKFDYLKEIIWLQHSKTGTKIKWTEEKIIEVAEKYTHITSINAK